MNPKDKGGEFPVTAEFRATAMALLSGFREARSVLDVYIHVLEYFEDMLAATERPGKPPPRVDPSLLKRAQIGRAHV